ncbi:hypothetical protein [uncultured Draconibacterium sp.]|uniref:hypothetical protein n=1 Tax=uncultured Draconibacterium sp. TaxID=1573823 RepID=UPI0032175E21
MQKLITIFLYLLAFTGSATEKDSLINRIFNSTYNQEYQSAELLLKTHKPEIDKLYFMVLSVDLSYWKNVTGTDHPNYNEFENTLEHFKPETTKTLENKASMLIYLSYRLRYELKRYQFLSAIFTLKQTNSVYSEIPANPKSSNLEHFELLQLYNSLFSYFNSYLNPFSGKSGSKKCEQAILSMEKLTRSEQNIVKTLANYFLGKTYLNYNKEPEKGLAHFSELAQQYPNNKKFAELKAECEKKSN